MLGGRTRLVAQCRTMPHDTARPSNLGTDALRHPTSSAAVARRDAERRGRPRPSDGPAGSTPDRTEAAAPRSRLRAGEGTRTPDLSLTRRLLYRLSYSSRRAEG